MMSLVAAWLGMTVLAGGGSCTRGGEFEPPLCPPGLPPVASLHVEQQGATTWIDPNGPSCRRFRLSERQIRLFFLEARRADLRAVHFTLPESPCSVLGRIAFSDGSTGSWRLDQFGLGWLERSNGERMVLYCPTCRGPWTR